MCIFTFFRTATCKLMRMGEKPGTPEQHFFANDITCMRVNCL